MFWFECFDWKSVLSSSPLNQIWLPWITLSRILIFKKEFGTRCKRLFYRHLTFDCSFQRRSLKNVPRKSYSQNVGKPIWISKPVQQSITLAWNLQLHPILIPSKAQNNQPSWLSGFWLLKFYPLPPSLLGGSLIQKHKHLFIFQSKKQGSNLLDISIKQKILI